MKLKLKKHLIGYGGTPAFTFNCSLCSGGLVHPDLSEGYVYQMAHHHLVSFHNIDADRIKVKIIIKE